MMSVQGPLARHVRDLRVGLAAMAGFDARDPWWVPAPLEGARLARPIKVALARKIDGLKLDPAVDVALAKAGQALADAGYAVEEVATPPIVEAGHLGFTLITQDTRLYAMEQIKQMADADGAKAVSLYDEAMPHLDAKQYGAALAERAKFLRQWLLFFERYPLVVAPVSARLPMEFGFDTRDAAATRALVTDQSPLIAFNLMGLPSVAVPVGLAQAADAPKGLPVGVQIVAARYREDLAIDAAEAVEARHSIATPIDPVA
jgi:amidase